MSDVTNHNDTPIPLITGGSRGLGRATALARADAGVDVIITYNSHEGAAREVVATIESKGRGASALKLDAADRASFGAFVEAVRGELPDGSFDILVNTAGTRSTARCRTRLSWHGAEIPGDVLSGRFRSSGRCDAGSPGGHG